MATDSSVARSIFLGSKRQGLIALRTIRALAPQSLCGIATLDDREDGRSVLDAFVREAHECGLPLFVARRPAESKAWILQSKADLGLVVGWYWILDRETRDAIPRGLLGLHNSLLPLYRGAAPLVWAIMNGDTRSGVSLFTLSERLDAGDLWAQRGVEVGPDDTVGEVLARLEDVSTALLRDHWLDVLSGRLRPSPQDDSNATYGVRRTPEDGRIDWGRPAGRVHDFIRALSLPYPGAFSELNGRKLMIWRARRSDVSARGRPGEVGRIEEDAVHVVCGDGRTLALREVSFEGAPPVSAPQVLNSPGILLGSE